MSASAKAAILYRTGEPLRVREIEIPPLQKGQVLVKMHFSGMCRSQLMEVRGGRGEDKWLPHMLGHEGSGTVLETGDGVTKVKPGDNVILGWLRGSGLEAPGATYRCGSETINSGQVTTFSTHTVVSENRLTPLPDGIPMDIAVLFGCALLTGAGMVLNELKPEPGSTVAVLGLGGIGFSALAALTHYSCRQRIAIDISDEKLALAKKFGATHTFNAGDANMVKAVLELTGGGADACIEAGGSTRTIETGFALIRPKGGKLLFASHPPDGEVIRLLPHELISGKQIMGSWGGASSPDRDVATIAGLYRQGKFPLEALLSKRYRLEQVNEALEDLEHGKVFRPLLVMEGL